LLILTAGRQPYETIMATRVPGEGDYAAARRYHEETSKFVKDKAKAGESIKGSADQAGDKLTPAEEVALKHAKGGRSGQARCAPAANARKGKALIAHEAHGRSVASRIRV
jgi:hypothetical protein